MRRVYIIEFKAVKKKQKIISKYTGYNYYHTAMVIPVKENLYFCDLSMRGGNEDYKIKKIDRIKYIEGDFDVVMLPHYFTDQECENMLKWWQDRKDKKYSVRKLLAQKNTKWMLRFSNWYYKKTGRVYIPVFDFDGDTCAIATDQTLKEAGNYDAFPWLSERVTPPGAYIVHFPECVYPKEHFNF